MKALELIKSGAKWNNKIYGGKQKSVYLNGEKFELTSDEFMAIQDYMILENGEYEVKEINGQRIIGFFHVEREFWKYISKKHAEYVAQKKDIQFSAIEGTNEFWMAYDKAYIMK